MLSLALILGVTGCNKNKKKWKKNHRLSKFNQKTI